MLYVNGDSWSQETDYTKPDQIWPSLLANKLGLTIFNESIGCGSNSRILDNLTNFYIGGNRPKLIVLAFTAHHRWHLPNKNFGSWNIGPAVAISDITGEKDNILREWVYKNSYYELDSVYRYYRTIWSLTQLCKKFECPYMFFQAWDKELIDLKLLDVEENIIKFVSKFYPNINDYYAKRYVNAFKFFQQDKDMCNNVEYVLKDLLSDNDLDSTQHPDANGHIKIADFIYSKIGEIT